MTPLDWNILSTVHAADVIGHSPWTVADLSVLLSTTQAVIRGRLRQLSAVKLRDPPVPPAVHLSTGGRVHITHHGREMMAGAARDPSLKHKVGAFRDAVLSGSIEVPGPVGPRLRPAPYSRAVLPTGGTRGGRKADAEAAALIDQARECETSVAGFLEGLRAGKFRVCRGCGPRPSADFEAGRRVCRECRRATDKARRPGRYRGDSI